MERLDVGGVAAEEVRQSMALGSVRGVNRLRLLLLLHICHCELGRLHHDHL